MKLELFLPFDKKYITQRFGQNANTSYEAAGLHGHTTTDWGVPYGYPGFNCCDGYCYSTMNKGNPDPARYRAVFMLVEDDKEAVELSYGHCNEIYAEAGKSYKAGDIIYTVGNTGEVYSNGVAVSREARLNGSEAGAHLHGVQVRPCWKVRQTKSGKQYLMDGHGLLYKDGYYYEVKDYDNGFNGCVDDMQFYNAFQAKDAKQLIQKQLTLISILKSLVELLSGSKK